MTNDDRWYQEGDTVTILVDRLLTRGIVIRVGRVLDTVRTADWRFHHRHPHEIYAPEEAT